MTRFNTTALLGVAGAALLLAPLASAHPHKPTAQMSENSKENIEDVETSGAEIASEEKNWHTKDWPNFGDKSQDTDTLTLEELGAKLDGAGEKMRVHVLRFSDEMEAARGNDIRSAAKALEDALGESGVISSLADILADFSEDIEVENEAEGATVLRFDGKTVGRIKRETDKKNALQIQGLGRNLTIDRKKVIRDGKTKTRIVIEMDGGEDLEINTPDTPPTP